MHLVALMVQPSGSIPPETIAQTFGVDWPHLVAQVISFSIVCLLLYWLAYAPILKMLDARRRQIAQGLENTRKIDAALAAIETTRQDILSAAHDEAIHIVDEARGVGVRLTDQERQRALASGERIVRKAQEQALQEHTRMLAELKREVGHLVVETAATVTGRILTSDDQRRLTQETTRHLDAA